MYERSFTDTYLLSSLFFDLTSPRVLVWGVASEARGFLLRFLYFTGQWHGF
jgi:hypothetical protein